MRTITAFAVCAASLAAASDARAHVDEGFGLALADLSAGHVAEARARLTKSPSPNSHALLARLDTLASPAERPRAPLPPFDLDDPTWQAFRDYVVELSKKDEYAFLRDVVRALRKDNPSADLGDLGIFENAYFSPGSRHLVLYSSTETTVLDARTGRALERWRSSASPVEVLYTRDEKHRLRCVHDPGLDEEAKTEIRYEDAATGKPLWTLRKHTHRVQAAFSRDFSQVVVFNYKAGEERTDVWTYRYAVADGKEVGHAPLRDLSWEAVAERFAREVAQAVERFPDPLQSERRIASRDGMRVLVGNATAGKFELRDGSSGKLVRRIVFASDVE